MTKVSKKEQVRQMIEEGIYTKKEIAEKLDMSESSVSSQMTYLRWAQNFIKTDAETKVISFCTKEEFEAWEAEKAANRSTSSSAPKDPQARANQLAKTIEKQEKQLANWEKKSTDIYVALEDEPDNEEIQELADEAGANITLLKIKIKRNKAAAAELPAPVEEEAVEDAPVEEEADLL